MTLKPLSATTTLPMIIKSPRLWKLSRSHKAPKAQESPPQGDNRGGNYSAEALIASDKPMAVSILALSNIASFTFASVQSAPLRSAL
jgi:hypothetical protein